TYDIGGRTTAVDDEFTCATTTFDYRDLVSLAKEGIDPGTCTGTPLREITDSYDGLGRLTNSEITAGEGDNDILAAPTYDSAGHQLSTSATKGTSTTSSAFAFNPLEEQVAETRSEDGTAISWTKTNADPLGNPTDRCVWNSSPGSELCKAVGASFTTVPSVHTSSAYDARNNRVSLKIPGAGETTYDPAHVYQVDVVYAPTKLNGSNQVIAEHRSDYGYDSRHRLTSVTHSTCPVTADTHTCSGGTTQTGSSTYVYDDNDNRTQVSESKDGGSAVTTYYCYDALNRLTSKGSTTCTTGTSEGYEYDAAGNRTRATLSSPQYFRYSSAGQLCEQSTTYGSCAADPATWQIRYDDAGRTKLWNSWNLTYDGEGRLATACKVVGCASNDMVTMRYDAQGHRVELVTRPNSGSATTTTFRYQGDAIAQEYTGTGTLTLVRTYVTDESGAIVKVCDPDCSGANPQYLVTWNGHGDALGLWKVNSSDGSLTLANSFSYSTWGTPTTTTHNSLSDLGFRFLYVGKFGVAWDSAFGLALEHMGARHYSPALGRFLQPDPSRLELNLYRYADNNPVLKADPTGTIAIVVPIAWCFANWPICGPMLAAGVLAVRNVLTYAPRVTFPRICLWDCGSRMTLRVCGIGGCLLLAQALKKALEGQRIARRDVLEKLRNANRNGDERAVNHWQRLLEGIERKIREILAKYPQWRVPDDPR
ncbi:MAG: hypothetical protein M3P52_02690, partial [Actinomycetota bacterium]|nr:hypothetical protein [Actinomycetota bacterium]